MDEKYSIPDGESVVLLQSNPACHIESRSFKSFENLSEFLDFVNSDKPKYEPDFSLYSINNNTLDELYNLYGEFDPEPHEIEEHFSESVKREGKLLSDHNSILSEFKLNNLSTNLENIPSGPNKNPLLDFELPDTNFIVIVKTNHYYDDVTVNIFDKTSQAFDFLKDDFFKGVNSVNKDLTYEAYSVGKEFLPNISDYEPSEPDFDDSHYHDSVTEATIDNGDLIADHQSLLSTLSDLKLNINISDNLNPVPPNLKLSDTNFFLPEDHNYVLLQSNPACHLESRSFKSLENLSEFLDFVNSDKPQYDPDFSLYSINKEKLDYMSDLFGEFDPEPHEVDKYYSDTVKRDGTFIADNNSILSYFKLNNLTSTLEYSHILKDNPNIKPNNVQNSLLNYELPPSNKIVIFEYPHGFLTTAHDFNNLPDAFSFINNFYKNNKDDDGFLEAYSLDKTIEGESYSSYLEIQGQSYRIADHNSLYNDFYINSHNTKLNLLENKYLIPDNQYYVLLQSNPACKIDPDTFRSLSDLVFFFDGTCNLEPNTFRSLSDLVFFFDDLNDGKIQYKPDFSPPDFSLYCLEQDTLNHLNKLLKDYTLYSPEYNDLFSKSVKIDGTLIADDNSLYNDFKINSFITNLKKNAMNEDLKPVGTAKTHTFENGSEVINLSIKKEDLLKLVPNHGKDGDWYNCSVIKDGDKMLIVDNPFYKTQESLKNVVLNFGIPVDKVKELEVTNGHLFITAGQKMEKEGAVEKPNRIDYVLYQSNKDKNEKPNYCGNAYKMESNSLGIAFIDSSKDGSFKMINASLNSDQFLKAQPDKNGNIYVNFAQIPGHDNMLRAYISTDKNDPNAIMTAVLKQDKVNIINPDKNNNFRITISEKKTIEKDNSSHVAYDSSSLSKGSTHFAVGKAFDKEHMYWNQKDTDKSNDFFYKAGDIVQFPVKDNFYMNKNLGNTEHVAFGSITGASSNGKLEVTSPCGDFLLDKTQLKPATKTALNCFTELYSSFKDNFIKEQSDSVKSKKALKAEAKSKQKETSQTLEKDDTKSTSQKNKNDLNM